MYDDLVSTEAQDGRSLKIDLDRKSTTKSFNFATKRNLDFYYVSAADGCDTPPCLGRPPALGPDKRRCRSAGQMS